MNLKEKLSLSALIAPVYAATGDTVKLVPGGGTGQFDQLVGITVPGIISGAISLVMLVVALVFFFMLVLGGLKWVMSGGDQKAVEAARSQITNALIGLAIVFAAWAIMKLIAIVFGVDIMNGITIPTFLK